MGRKRGNRLWSHTNLKISALPLLSGATLDKLLDSFSRPWFPCRENEGDNICLADYGHSVTPCKLHA